MCWNTAVFAPSQTITHMIDDELSDALLHKAVQPGEIAFMELSRRSMQVVCTGKLRLRLGADGVLRSLTKYHSTDHLSLQFWQVNCVMVLSA